MFMIAGVPVFSRGFKKIKVKENGKKKFFRSSGSYDNVHVC